MISFTLRIKPEPKERPRLGRRGAVYTPFKTKIFERTVRQLAKAYWPSKPLEGPVAIQLSFMMKAPVRRKQSHPISRPDLDNLIKSITDAFNGVFWKDDSQITQIAAEKIYSYMDNQPAIHVRIESLAIGEEAA